MLENIGWLLASCAFDCFGSGPLWLGGRCGGLWNWESLVFVRSKEADAFKIVLAKNVKAEEVG